VRPRFGGEGLPLCPVQINILWTATGQKHEGTHPGDRVYKRVETANAVALDLPEVERCRFLEMVPLRGVQH
jgi:hypothetical protein